MGPILNKNYLHAYTIAPENEYFVFLLALLDEGTQEYDTDSIERWR